MLKRIVFFAMEIQGNAFRNKDKLLVKYSDFTPMLGDVFSILKNFEVRLYHFPLCTLKPEFWPYAWRTLEDRKIKFTEDCEKCSYKKYCLGILKTYAANIGLDEFKPVNQKFKVIETGNDYNPVGGLK